MTITKFFSNTFLFRGMGEEKIKELIADAPIEKKFERGELIFSCNSYDKMLGFVREGECEVLSQNSRVPLNTLSVYSSFGISAIFSQENDFSTNVYAKRRATVLFIEQEDLLRMIDTSPEISKNIIAFLSGRIAFLNKKITAFSQENVESKLTAYLMEKGRSLGDTFPLNVKHAAEEINAGRASLYRALERLQEGGIIREKT